MKKLFLTALINCSLIVIAHAQSWQITGNNGTVNGIHFLGTNDNVPLSFRVNNISSGRIDHILHNSFFGFKSGISNTTGFKNNAMGSQSLYSNTTGNYNNAIGFASLYSNTIGYNNNAVGYAALYYNISGIENSASGTLSLYTNSSGNYNSAFGTKSLYLNTTGNYNSAVGLSALYSNTSGLNNSAFGANALFQNTTGLENTGIGVEALKGNITGESNTGVGYSSLFSNTVGKYNSAVGNKALFNNISGKLNTATGHYSLFTNTTGDGNTAFGAGALDLNTTGANNTAVGLNSLLKNTLGNSNVAIGNNALNANTIGDNNTAIGSEANVLANNLTNATAIGYKASVGSNNSIVLGSISGVNGATVSTNIGIGISNPDKSAALDVTSTTQGFLPPRLTNVQRNAIANPVAGLMIWNKDCSGIEVYNGTQWLSLTGVASTCNPIGCNQVWMTKNLDVSNYSNGDPIPQVTNPTAWANLNTGAWCYYNNVTSNGVVYGKLYNWYAVMDPRGLAPTGWHIPSKAEWDALINCNGGFNIAGGALKETGLAHWFTPNAGATNSIGFLALPGGNAGAQGGFAQLGSDSYWWSSSSNSYAGFYYHINHNNGVVVQSNGHKNNGYSVRCVQ